MEKKLEKMRAELRARIIQSNSVFILFLIFFVVDISGKLAKYYEQQFAADFIQGFVIGIVIVVELLSLYKLVTYFAALKDDAKLKQLYYKEHDERVLAIDQIAGRNCNKYSMVILLFIAMVVSPFSFEAFIGLIGAVVVIGLTFKICRIYYSRKYTGE